MDALVTDAQHRSAVAGLRGLGRAGLNVLAVASSAGAGGLWSRYAAGRATAPSPTEDPGEFTSTIGRLARDRGPLVVYPGTEDSIDPLVSGPLPPEATLPFPANGAVARLRDKRATSALARAVGLDAPQTLVEGTVDEIARTGLPTPCVLKSARGKGPFPAIQVHTAAELERRLHGLPGDEPLIVQELVTGALTAMAVVVARDGSLVARHQQTAERLWPSMAGGSSLAVSVPPDEELAAKTAALLAEAGYWGLAHVQFIAAARGPLLIDVNLRFYGTLPLALACGVNLPAAWHAVATGDSLPVPGPYRVGVRYRRLVADVTAALAGSPQMLMTPLRGPRTGSIWDPRDPLSSGLLAVSATVSMGKAGSRSLRRRVRRPRAAAEPVGDTAAPSGSGGGGAR